MTFKNADDVIKELLLEPEHNYGENVREILGIYFKEHPDMLQEWLDWFNKKN